MFVIDASCCTLKLRFIDESNFLENKNECAHCREKSANLIESAIKIPFLAKKVSLLLYDFSVYRDYIYTIFPFFSYLFLFYENYEILSCTNL